MIYAKSQSGKSSQNQVPYDKGHQLRNMIFKGLTQNVSRAHGRMPQGRMPPKLWEELEEPVSLLWGKVV